MTPNVSRLTRVMSGTCIAALPVVILSAACTGGANTSPAATASTDVANTSPTVTASIDVANASPAAITNMDVPVGAPPPEGWRWVVAAIDTAADEVRENPNPGHEFFWVFFVVKGSTEVAAASGPRLASAGEGIFVPAKQAHSHQYPAQSRTLAFDVRSANDNPSAFHRGTKVLLSERLPLGSAPEYKLRVRTYTLAPGQRLENTISDPSFVYVAEGTAASTIGQDTGRIAENAALALSPGTKLVVKNDEKTTLRFLVVDVHP